MRVNTDHVSQLNIDVQLSTCSTYGGKITSELIYIIKIVLTHGKKIRKFTNKKLNSIGKAKAIS